MSVDLEPKPDGRMHFTLGPVEKWAITAAGLVVGLGVWQVRSTQALLVQNAVMSKQLETMSGQLVDLPSIRMKLAEQSVQVDRNTKDIAELQQTRGLK